VQISEEEMGWNLNPLHALSSIVRTGEHLADDGAKAFEGALNDAAKVAKNMSPSDFGHLALNVVGMLPVVGAPADAINAGWYAAQGDWTDAALSAATAIPFAGDAAGALKLGKNVVEIAEDGAKVERSVADGAKIEGAVKDAKAVGGAADGGKVVSGAKSSGPWVEEASNVKVGGDVVTQSTPAGCVSASGEMLTDGAVSQSQLLEKLGQGSNPRALAKDLNQQLGTNAWRGGYLDEANALAVAKRGRFAAVLQAPGGIGHMVVIEPLKSGKFFVRDPLPGSTYEVTASWIEKYVAGGVWK